MSVHAGQILHIGGLNIIDRVQRAGLGNAKVRLDVIREVGNEKIVEKVPEEPDFTFTVESFDVSTELEAFLFGKSGAQGEIAGTVSASSGVGSADPDGTVYEWSNCGFVNVPSPWKDGLSSAGKIDAGHLIPGYYPTKFSYRFGITESAQETAELAGGAFYYNGNAPVEEFPTGDGFTVAFATSSAAVPYRIGGADGTTFKSVFGVIVDGVLQSEGVDYVSTPTNTAAPGTATITFFDAPKSGALIRFTYFTTVAQAYPDTDLADTSVKPGAVRGRHVCVYLGESSGAVRVGAVQTFQLDASTTGQVERELCSTEVVGYTVQGRDCTGNMVVRARDADSFLKLLSKVTGVDADEVIGWLNINTIPLTVKILNPRDPSKVIKSIRVPDAIFQPPGTEARVNQPTDFTIEFESKQGDFQVIKGDVTL